jgi:hydrogenase/urease accessory protein HupE
MQHSGGVRRAAAALGTWLLGLGLAGAHELGTVQVDATFLRDGTYRIEAAVDLEHLRIGLGPDHTLDGSIARLRPVAPEIRRRYGQFVRDYLIRTVVAFDGVQVQPEVESIETGTASSNAGVQRPVLTLRYAGPIPPGARSFLWSNSTPLGTYLLALRHEGEADVERQWLEAGKESRPFVLRQEVVPPDRIEVIGLYLKLGFTHILPEGLDHILFVLSIFLLCTRLRPMLVQVSAFTVAHTITLALTIYGVVSLPSSVVEPLIAVSIVYVAVENLLTPRLKPSRVALVFGFGLLHGMGFAGVLNELGLPRSEFLTALISFNVGVELGQLAVITLAFLAVGLWFRHRPWYRRGIVVPASAAIGLVGLYWAIERTLL